MFGYDAVDDTKKRRRPSQVRQMSEDNQLKQADRKKLVATTRDVRRNYEIAAWMIRKHLDYVSTFDFQARTPDEDFNRRLEELVTWWSRRRNFDVARRHNRQRFIRLGEACRTVDGDFFAMKLSSGRVQGIEGDRIRTPTLGVLPNGLKIEKLIHGIQLTPAGAAKAYCLCDRNKWGDGFVFKRMVPARHMLQHGYFDRFDQVRGISPLASALNRLRDTYENFDYALAKAKVTQLFALAFYREAEEAMGDVTALTDDAGEEDKSKYEVDFGRGPMSLDLDPGDRAEFLESKHPSGEFRQFSNVMIAVALKALDIPFSFFDESFTNYSGSRQALLLYEQSAQIKQQDNRELLDALTAWRIGLWILDGQLVLPAEWTIDGLQWEWIHKGIPWLDPLKEVKAEDLAVGRGFSSTPRVCKGHGTDAYELVDEEAAYQEYRREKLGVSVQETGGTIDSALQGLVSRAVEEAIDSAEEKDNAKVAV